MRTTLIASVLILSATSASAMPLDYMTTTVDTQMQTVAFAMHFTGVPDFTTTDQFGQLTDSFQLYLYATPPPDLKRPDGGSVTLTPVSIVRGDELQYGAGLVLRNSVSDATSANDPHSGGWGSIREVDAVTLTGTTLTWTSTLAGLAVGSPFGYAHETFAFGGSSDFFGGCTSTAPCATPEPSTLWSVLLGGAALFAWLIGRAR